MRIYKENKIKDLDYLEILKTIPDEIENQELAKVDDFKITYDNKVKIIYDNSINLGGLYRLISVYILIVHGIFPYFCPSIEMRVLNGR